MLPTKHLNSIQRTHVQLVHPLGYVSSARPVSCLLVFPMRTYVRMKMYLSCKLCIISMQTLYTSRERRCEPKICTRNISLLPFDISKYALYFVHTWTSTWTSTSSYLEFRSHVITRAHVTLKCETQRGIWYVYCRARVLVLTRCVNSSKFLTNVGILYCFRTESSYGPTDRPTQSQRVLR